jgi:FlgD Ig-like domain
MAMNMRLLVCKATNNLFPLIFKLYLTNLPLNIFQEKVMRNILIILIALLFLPATFCTAQEPQWELFAEGKSGTITIDPTDSQTVYINARWKTTDGGTTWDTIGVGLNLTRSGVLIDPDNPNTLWAGGHGSPDMGIAKSIDGGLNWFKSDSGIAWGPHGYEILGMEIDRTRNILYAYDNIVPVYKSTNGGSNWESISTLELPAGTDLAIDEDDGALYFATDGVWKKELNNEEWIPVYTGLPQNHFGQYFAGQVSAVNGSNTLYCTSFNTTGPGSRLYKSYNNGGSWQPLDLVVSRPSDIKVFESDTSLVIIASQTEFYPDTLIGGIFISPDGGNTWSINYNGLPDSLPFMSCDYLDYDASTNMIYASLALFNSETAIHGIYKLSLSKPTTIQTKRIIPNQAELFQAFPNPFNASISIAYEIKKTEVVHLKIYNINGKEVKNLVNRTEHHGFYKIKWDGKNNQGISISGGIYFVHIQTGNSIQTRKIIYLP